MGLGVEHVVQVDPEVVLEDEVDGCAGTVWSAHHGRDEQRRDRGANGHFFISSASVWMRPASPPKSGGFAGGVFGFATVAG